MSESDADDTFPACKHCGKVFLERNAVHSHEWSCTKNPDGGSPGGGDSRRTALESYADTLRERLEDGADLPKTSRELDEGAGVYSTAHYLSAISTLGPICGVRVENHGRGTDGCIRWEVTLDGE